MHLDNVGMAQFGNDTRLALEAEQRVRIILTQVSEDLDCHFVFQGNMRAYIDLCYTTPSHQRFDLNLPQSFPNPIGHNQIILKAQNSMFAGAYYKPIKTFGCLQSCFKCAKFGDFPAKCKHDPFISSKGCVLSGGSYLITCHVMLTASGVTITDTFSRE
jgi:hypothetical protein